MPVSPEPVLAPRLSTHSSSGHAQGGGGNTSTAAARPLQGSFSEGEHGGLLMGGDAGPRGKRRGPAGPGKPPGSMATSTKQRLTLSEIGMLHGAW